MEPTSLKLPKKKQNSVSCVVPENIHTPPTEVFSGLNPPPIWTFQFRLILYFKNFGLQDCPPPSEFPMTLCGGGYGYFLEPHIPSLCVIA